MPVVLLAFGSKHRQAKLFFLSVFPLPSSQIGSVPTTGTLAYLFFLSPSRHRSTHRRSFFSFYLPPTHTTQVLQRQADVCQSYLLLDTFMHRMFGCWFIRPSTRTFACCKLLSHVHQVEHKGIHTVEWPRLTSHLFFASSSRQSFPRHSRAQCPDGLCLSVFPLGTGSEIGRTPLASFFYCSPCQLLGRSSVLLLSRWGNIPSAAQAFVPPELQDRALVPPPHSNYISSFLV